MARIAGLTLRILKLKTTQPSCFYAVQYLGFLRTVFGNIMAMQSATESDNSFLSRARYPKGREALKSILDATYEVVTKQGLSAASQEAIAQQANVTKSAVRHYFSTKEELLLAFFTVGVERLEAIVEVQLHASSKSPREKLLGIVSTHYDWMNATDDVYYFEAAAYWGRHPEFGEMRERWYQRLIHHYKQSLREVHPDWSSQRCDAASFQILTLVLGGWATMGACRATHKNKNAKELKDSLLDGIKLLIG